MLTDYERNLLAFYLANIAARVHRKDPEARKLVDWVEDEDNRVAFPGRKRRRTDPWDRHHDEKKVSSAELRRLNKTLRARRSADAAKPDRTALRLERLGKIAGFDRTDVDILELLLRYRTHSVFESMIDDIFEGPGPSAGPLNIGGWAVPLVLGLKANAVQSRFRDGAPLIRSGLVHIDSDGDLEPIGRLRRLVTTPDEGNGDVSRLLLDVARPGELEWQEFDHIAGNRDHVETLAKGALDSGASGVNILLYGPPGTGKTEFCKTLAQRLGATLYSVGEADEDGDEPSRSERLQELRLAQHLLTGNRRSLLLFDEMEDLFEQPFGSVRDYRPYRPWRSSGSCGVGSKVFMHRLLERAPVATLWTMNDARAVSPAILRRMMFAIELRLPPARVRARVWSRQLDRHGIVAAPDEVQALAAEFDATPGVAAGATAAAHLAGGDIAAVRRGVESLSRLLSCGRTPQAAPADYDPGLIRADTDPVALAGRLERTGARRFSICLQGPPGTGKSAYVRYLAERLGLEVVQKRASDLMSMWVGQTERQIADAFAEARDAGAFLVFDEADSLLGDRRFAVRSWEVS